MLAEVESCFNEQVPDPAEEYRSRLDGLQKQRNILSSRDRVFIASKIVVGVVTVGLAVWLAKYHTAQIAWLLLPVTLLVVLFARHEKVLQALRSNSLLKAYYERGVARLEDRWFNAEAKTNAEETGERFLDPRHPYARDLDLFGPGSLYHLLCTAQTRAGQETLATWLLTAAPHSEILPRQAAVQELAALLDFREKLALAGDALQEKVRRTGAMPESLADWSESTAGVHRSLRLPALLLGLGWVIAILGWQIQGGEVWIGLAVLMTFVVRIFGSRFKEQVKQSAARIEAATGDLDVLAGVLRTIEQQQFTSKKLTQIQSRFHTSGLKPSQSIARLQKRIDWLSSADNWFVKILDGFIFWRLQSVIAIEDWRRVHGAAVRSWLEAIGEVEALTAFSVYAYEHPEDAFPTFVEDGVLFEADEFAHPLLPRKRAVRNSMKLDHELQLIVISGPNMAGKSTFIRSVGVNAVLAQAGAPVRARRLRMSSMQVAASICILDSLQGGLSRFYAEILRLKDIDALSRGPVPVLFLLDELLSGTNSHDRRIGTESMVRSLVTRNAVGLVTTHDLALAEIANQLEGRAANYHFEDRYEDGKLHFEYRLKPGIVQTSNALQLMRSIGLDV
jgi:hypothetical protein